MTNLPGQPDEGITPDSNAGSEESPQVYAVKKDLTGWEFSRRDFLAMMGATTTVAMAAQLAGKSSDTPARPTLQGRNTIYAHRDDVLALAMSSQGPVLVSGGKDNIVKLWAMPEGGLFKILSNHTAPVKMLAVSPDGATLVSVSRDNTIRLWSLPEGDALGSITGLEGINGVSISPDSTLLAVASSNGIVSLWSLPDGTSVAELQSGDGVWTISAAGNVNVRSCPSTDCDILTTVASGETLNVLSTQEDWLEVQLTDGSTGFVAARLATYSGAGVAALAFHPDGSTLAAASTGGKITLWSLPDGTPLLSLDGYVTGENWVVTSDGEVNVRASASTNGEIINTVETGEILNVINTSNDWHTVRVGSRTGYVAAWLTEQIAASNLLAVSPDGSLLAAAGDNGSVQVFSLPDGESLHTLEGPGVAISAIAISPDSTFLVAADNDGKLRVWSLPDGVELASMSEHLGRVNIIAISPDSSLIASASTDNSVRLWSAASNRSLAQLLGHSANVNAVAITPDGTLLASASNDNTIRLWQLPGGRFLRELMDLSANSSDVEGRRVEVPGITGGTITMTLPCGSPMPAGAVCVCNCVEGTLCSCVGYVAPTAVPTSCACDTVCTCDSVCTCQGVCSCDGYCSCVGYFGHYWYPN